MLAVPLSSARGVEIVSAVSGTRVKTLDRVIPENSYLSEGQYQEIACVVKPGLCLGNHT